MTNPLTNPPPDNRRGWQPIASAPENQWILLFDEEWEMTLGTRHVGMILDGEVQVEGVEDFNPTHWHKLPEPPSP